jgi:hypothetical protein
MRGLTTVEYDEIQTANTPCDGDPGGVPIGADQENRCERLRARGLLCHLDGCSCGWRHYDATSRGRDALWIEDTIRTMEGGK